MNANELIAKFHEIATNPRVMMDKYLADNKRVILTAPVYTPEEIIHSMGYIPMGAWGADIRINDSKQYFPAFICSIMQTILELGMKGAYKGASAIVIPSLCDSLKCLGQNWKCAVKDIPFIPMTYPQNRKPTYGCEFTKAGYNRVINDIEALGQAKFDESKLLESIKIYNEHNEAMRSFAKTAAKSVLVTPQVRSDVFKSAYFMEKSEHTALVNELISELEKDLGDVSKSVKIMTVGILADSPALLQIFSDLSLKIVADDIAAESCQYRVDAPVDSSLAIDAMVTKFRNTDSTSVMYDPAKKRCAEIAKRAKEAGADGLVYVLTKFCDPDEFDYPMIKKACDEADIPCILIEVDRQMENMEQARTMLQTFTENI